MPRRLTILARGRLAGLLALLAMALQGCGPSRQPAAALTDVGILDYRQPYAFDAASKYNRLLIEVESRLRIIEGGHARRYVMLSPHPRELTFDARTSPYREMLENSGGGSDITFVHALDDDRSMISRRFEHPDAVPRQLLHECPKANHAALKTPRELQPDQVRPLSSLAEIMAAAQSRLPIVGRLVYKFGAKATIVLDFPIRLVNIKPGQPEADGRRTGSVWQAVSAPVPLLIGDPDIACEATRPAVFAFRDFSGLHSAVRLCEQTRGSTTSQDFSCPIEVAGQLSLFAVVDRDAAISPTP